MVFEQVFSPESIILDLQSETKDALFEEMADAVISVQPQINRSQALNALHERENKMSTGIMHAIAVPHAQCQSVTGETGAIGISRKGIDYDSLDKAPVNLVFMMLCNPSETELHLQLLKELAAVLQNPAFLKEIMDMKTSKEVYDTLIKYEKSVSL